MVSFSKGQLKIKNEIRYPVLQASLGSLEGVVALSLTGDGPDGPLSIVKGHSVVDSRNLERAMQEVVLL